MKSEVLEYTSREVEVGKWKISKDYGIVHSAEGKTVILEPRLSKLMYFLCANDSTVVSREYLIENIWKETIVNEESLTRAIADLRKQLSDNFIKAPKIETIRKRGYKITILPPPKVYALKLRLNKSSFYGIAGFVLLVSLAMLVFTIFKRMNAWKLIQ
ncbi:winged helix-turn-helix domain-containing protein [Aureisphaera galaxeae]|uniref:winged helix-turn-helix domain-containing protein n=1 Tax=Aureisphaera galaxeae TaxID=1538023 RepID=UPI00235102FE|nr:winged helix-turn-helix domain-containing protein [Aureisphaera galaxeae]MDC8004696.1 winged helix-turn-helix domain-containing protein [Aureisphaera galaxeae]